LFASFSRAGTWEFNGIWHQLASHDATMLAGVSNNNVYAVFSGDKTGTWSSTGGWHQISTGIPIAMDASIYGAMYAGYGDGTYEYNGGWTKFTDEIATQIAAIDNVHFVDSFASGTAEFDSFGDFPFPGENWLRIDPNPASHLGHSGSTLILSVGNGTFEDDPTSGNPERQIDWFDPPIMVG
jgi:hypothetical protein